jgi:5-formyltetrahydrofolate cyclo-ligase
MEQMTPEEKQAARAKLRESLDGMSPEERRAAMESMRDKRHRRPAPPDSE